MAAGPVSTTRTRVPSSTGISVTSTELAPRCVPSSHRNVRRPGSATISTVPVRSVPSSQRNLAAPPSSRSSSTSSASHSSSSAGRGGVSPAPAPQPLLELGGLGHGLPGLLDRNRQKHLAFDALAHDLSPLKSATDRLRY